MEIHADGQEPEAASCREESSQTIKEKREQKMAMKISAKAEIEGKR